MGMTLAEKILARASGQERVTPGQYVTAQIDLAMAHEGLAAVFMNLARAGWTKVWDPSRIVALLDHYVPAPTERSAEIHKVVRAAVKQWGIQHFYGERAGICHQVLPEKGHILPGMLIVGTDSHTTTYGAFGAAGTGIGFTDMAYVFATGKLWFKVPETIRFDLQGKLPEGVMSKDIILSIAGKYSAEVAQYKAVEFIGPLAEEMSLASRMTMSNMAVEIGAKFGFFIPDQKVSDFLQGRGQTSFPLISPDADAPYEAIYQIEVSSLEPQVAYPYSVDNVRPVSEAQEVKIHQAFIGSCTNGRLEDLHMAVKILKGKKVHADVRLLIIPASWEIYQEAIKDGTLEALIDAGAVIGNSSCGPCFGAHMGLLGSEENCIAAINRNFKGRMGSQKAQVFLSSPATVAASALEGKITDPRNYL
ncbi:MAG: 3-isopropylmalate dehydratase large subunit [Thermodesulfobacteriota bacterium]|nr:3-isopropylmalate dehydratase large subunit [Thermodesulfobacteriota bacterium]